MDLDESFCFRMHFTCEIADSISVTKHQVAIIRILLRADSASEALFAGRISFNRALFWEHLLIHGSNISSSSTRFWIYLFTRLF